MPKKIEHARALRNFSLAFLLCGGAAHADVYRFPAADGHLETSGDGCSGPVMKEITRAVADAIDDTGLTVELTEKTFEVVRKLPNDGERRSLAPRHAFTSGGAVGIWTIAAKTQPGDLLTTVTIGDIVPCDPLAHAHGCKLGELQLERLGSNPKAAIGATFSLRLGKCVTTWTNARGVR